MPGMTVAENLMLRTYHVGRGFTLHRGEGRSAAAETVEAYRVDTPSIDTKVKLLSGGNIQKIILARELRGDPRLIVASHPTYGLDVGATEQIREALVEQRGRGAAVLLLSEDLEELMALSGDTGARAILKAHPDDVALVPVDNPGVLLDLDTHL